MQSIIIIPARMDGERLPGKPLADVDGKPLLHWIYDRAKRTIADYVGVATPDNEIARYCEDQRIPWWLTSRRHITGTHRCAEVIRIFQPKDKFDVVVNWQCDVMAEPEDVDNLIQITGGTRIATLVGPPPSDPNNPNRVKVIVLDEWCHWFSRAPMAAAKSHIGIYAYQTDFLKTLGKLGPTKYSQAESLEQLAWYEIDHCPYAVEIDKTPLSIDTQEDLDNLRLAVDSGEIQ